MNLISLFEPFEIRDGIAWHQGHKHFEFEPDADGNVILQSRHKDKIIQIYIASDGSSNISRFYEVGGKYYSLGEINFPPYHSGKKTTP